MNELYEKVFWDDTLNLSDRKISTNFSFTDGKNIYKEEIIAKDLIIQKIYFAKKELSELKGINKETIKELKELQYLFEEYYPTHFGEEQIRFGKEYESIQFIKSDLEQRISSFDENIKVSDIKKVCENYIKDIIKDDYKYQRETIKREIAKLQKDKNDENKRLFDIQIKNLKLDLAKIPRKIDIALLLSENGLSTNKDYKTTYTKIGLV